MLCEPCRDASRCYEAMCAALPWRERGTPLQLTFVATQVFPSGAPPRPQVRRPAASKLGFWAGGACARCREFLKSLLLPPPPALSPLSAMLPCLLPFLQRPPNHVWIPGVGSAADEGDVLRCCKEGDIPPPEHLLKVRLLNFAKCLVM